MDFLDLGLVGLETLLIFQQEEFDQHFIESKENLHNRQIMTSNFEKNSTIEMDEEDCEEE